MSPLMLDAVVIVPDDVMSPLIVFACRMSPFVSTSPDIVFTESTLPSLTSTFPASVGRIAAADDSTPVCLRDGHARTHSDPVDRLCRPAGSR